MECVTTATASVLVNTSSTNESKFERGLRQGDPLSQFLFLIVVEGTLSPSQITSQSHTYNSQMTLF